MKKQAALAMMLAGLMLVFAAVPQPLAAQDQQSPDQADAPELPGENGAAEDGDETRQSRLFNPDRLGVIFSTPSILLEIDQYQNAGIGAKAFWGDLAFRGLLGFRVASDGNPFSINFGTAAEYHFLPGRISPYFGGALQLEYERHDDDIVDRVFRLDIGPLFGVEFAPIEMLSLFAEYSLNFAAAYSRAQVAGTTSETWNYELATGLGNRGRIGVVIYFLDRRDTTADRT